MDKKVLFEALNTELAKENIDLEILVKRYGLEKKTSCKLVFFNVPPSHR